MRSIFLLKSPFVVSYHTYEFMPSILVKIKTDEGIVGYGEGVADENVIDKRDLLGIGKYTRNQRQKPI